MRRNPAQTKEAQEQCRYSYITHLRRAGIDDSDLAQIAGHRLSTMLARYAHPVGGSFEDVRRAIG